VVRRFSPPVLRTNGPSGLSKTDVPRCAASIPQRIQARQASTPHLAIPILILVYFNATLAYELMYVLSLDD